jgi:hypothetical protein
MNLEDRSVGKAAQSPTPNIFTLKEKDEEFMKNAEIAA